MFTRISRRALRRAAVPAALLVALSAAPLASAADAPTRRTNINPEGRIVENTSAVGISPDGREAIVNQADPYDTTPGALSKGTRIAVVDLANSKTTVISDSYDYATAASDDLQRVLLSTTRKLSPDDTNTTADLYLYDRRTGTNQLVTRAVTGGPALGGSGYYANPALSGDGNAVIFSVGDVNFDTGYHRTVRFDAAKNTIATIAENTVLSQRVTDYTGRIAITYQGYYVGTKKLAVPSNVSSEDHLLAAVSPDGKTIFAFRHTTDVETDRVVINTTTGAVKTAPLKGLFKDLFFGAERMNNDGIVFAVVATPAGDAWKYQAYRLKVTTGQYTQFGGDFPSSEDFDFTPTGSFLLTKSFLVQLGTAPIPGTDWVPTRPAAAEYLQYDQGCKANPLNGTAGRRPSITLRGPDGPQVGADFPDPVKADITVKIDKTGGIANMFSIGFGQSRSLTAGFGGFTYTGTVTFTDGFKSTAVVQIAPYAATYCWQAPPGNPGW